MSSAVVFAYHEVGVRCLKVLIAHGVKIPLVVTHRDNPGERIWFGSVAGVAQEYGIEVITPEDANDPAVVDRIADCSPDFLFSFYFRQMLKPPLLAAARRGAFNMHGSLLPRYRGRVPVNWAVLHGERETGATLHAMTPKPDDGAIVDQQAIPILPDDTAAEVFSKVTVAAEMVLDRCLPALLAGTARLHAQDASQASYFGGRRPEDGRIRWREGARAVHDLVRAVAPPYPGAFCEIGRSTLQVLRTLRVASTDAPPASRVATARQAAASQAAASDAMLFVHDGHLFAVFADGAMLRVLDATLDGVKLDALGFRQHFGDALAIDDETSAQPGAANRP